jgi:cyclophilin family peptidyl-prolyl cis-trans isomerase
VPRQEKRARQKAARAARLAELERARKRKANIRRFTVIGFIAIVVIGIIALAGGFSSSKSATTTTTSSTSSTSTTSSSTSTTTAVSARQAAADAVAVAAGCPSSPTTPLTKTKYSKAPALTIDTSATYKATVKTDVGTFVITLDAKESPIAVNSFVFLARHDFFNCVIFHRVIPGFVVQGGDPTGTGSGGPGYQFTEQGPPLVAKGAVQYPLGSVAMANSNSPASTDPNTNGSQFFIVTGSSGETLSNDYVLFGQVTSGMSVVDKINDDGSSSGVPPTVTHRMLTVTITQS